MVEPPKLSPFGAADEADLVAALRKSRGEDASRRNAAHPVQSPFLRRVFAVNHLNAMRIQKRFDGLCETDSVLPDVLDFFFEVPFEFHWAEHTTLGRYPTSREETVSATIARRAAIRRIGRT